MSSTKTNKSVESVLHELRTGIQRGRYAPGQRLVTTDLASQLGTSFAPVREALHILAGEGLVDIRPNKGASVISLSPQTFVDGLQILEVTGGLALRLIAPRLTEKKLQKEIGKALECVLDAGKRRHLHEFFGSIAASHRLVNTYAGNAYLNPILNRLHLEYFYRQMADYLPEGFWDMYCANYRETGDHLLRGNSAAAERAWRAHIHWLIDAIQKRNT